MIRQGIKGFTVRPMRYEEAIAQCPRVAAAAATRYRNSTGVESERDIRRTIDAGRSVPGVLEYFGCFCGEQLVSYCESYVSGNAVWFYSIRHAPAFLDKYSSYGLVNGLLEYYLNERRADYVLDGARNLLHDTRFQDQLERVFGFQRVNACLRIVYAGWFQPWVVASRPIEGLLRLLPARARRGPLCNVTAILTQDRLHRMGAAAAAERDRGEGRSLTDPRPPASGSHEASRLTRYLLSSEICDVEVRAIAELHCQAIPHGFLSCLGNRFLGMLYDTVQSAPDATLVVARQGDRVVGFISGVVSVGGLQRRFLREHLVRGGLILLRQGHSLSNLRHAFETLTYPLRERTSGDGGEPLPAAELISMAVAEDQRGSGIAAELYRQLCHEFEQRGTPAFRIVVGAQLAPARRFYAKMGAREVRTLNVHRGEESLILIQQLPLQPRQTECLAQ